jgi:hypothetical protein
VAKFFDVYAYCKEIKEIKSLDFDTKMLEITNDENRSMKNGFEHKFYPMRKA